ncbi:glycoside hydrolase family 19 protein [Pseudomonas azerbaijanoccidens]|uniref:glycoside hydrolase family 19 protein n=1 Tax=Pseudomonas azerbaijanoccidentalis TaxID=2842347 RepID=UPI00200AF213|nr:glycoside hydrolase family 19 protein [Pseudomonas azerbaijanoccidentalis]MCK8667936.1 glycoside hydrolase family 19 protein [Pseudomonas azerbaijanoccidentalis]
MALTEQQLQRIMPNARRQAGVFVSALNAAMANWQINTPKRQAAFIAQVGHESGQLQYVRELGGDHYLSKYDTGSLAAKLGNTPEADGDGQRYRGRGLIQITGHDNYLRCSLALFGDERLLRTPELLELPQWAAESAAWFWFVNGLNALADQNEFNTITRRINGGLNGLQDRLELWERARAVLCVSAN